MNYNLVVVIIKGMENEIEIRASQLSNCYDCPRRAATKIIPDLIKEQGFKTNKILSGASAFVGIAGHKCNDFVLKEKQKTGELGALKRGVDYAISEFEEGIKEGVEWDEVNPSQNDAERKIIEVSREYYDKVAPHISPASENGLEMTLRAKIKEGYVLKGTLDVYDGENGKLRVRDTKFGSQKPLAGPQLGAYNLLLKMNGYKVNSSPLIDWIPQKKPEYSIIEFDTKINEEHSKFIINRIIKDIERFKETRNPWSFMPNPNSGLCVEKCCPAYSTDFCGVSKK